MCNLYSIITNQEAIRALFRVINRYVGNLPPMPGVFPDDPAPVARDAGDEREMTITLRHLERGSIWLPRYPQRCHPASAWCTQIVHVRN
jgi:putative SOS response-associated peptidase YedK